MSAGESRRRRLGGVSVGYRDRVDLSARNLTPVRAASHRFASSASAACLATKNPSLQGRAVTRGTTPLARPIGRTASFPDHGGHRTGLPRQTLQPVGSGATFGQENPPAHTISGSLGVLGRPTPPRQRLCVERTVPRHRDRHGEPSAQHARCHRTNALRLRQIQLCAVHISPGCSAWPVYGSVISGNSGRRSSKWSAMDHNCIRG